jgi:TDG/mug DNA glycosylase family protein
MTGHRVTTECLGTVVETLADLIPEAPRAICVGINPAPISVAVGHYYQGRQGQRFFRRLRHAGVLGAEHEGFEDDAAVKQGLGFTDIVKRPTARADQITAAERRQGARILAEKLEAVHAPALIFPFSFAGDVTGGEAAAAYKLGLGCSPVFTPA